MPTKAFASEKNSGLEVFLKLKFPQLNRIAIGPDRPREEWLTESLQQCESTAEKLALERALANQLPQALKQR